MKPRFGTQQSRGVELDPFSDPEEIVPTIPKRLQIPKGLKDLIRTQLTTKEAIEVRGERWPITDPRITSAIGRGEIPDIRTPEGLDAYNAQLAATSKTPKSTQTRADREKRSRDRQAKEMQAQQITQPPRRRLPFSGW